MGLLKIIERNQVATGYGRSAQRPEVFGRLEFRGVGRQEEQMDVIGHAQFDTGRLAGTIEEGSQGEAQPAHHLPDLLARIAHTFCDLRGGVPFGQRP